MRRRQFLNLGVKSVKVSVVGGLALSGAAVAHRLLWDYAPDPDPAPVAPTQSGIASGIASSIAEPRCLSHREQVILRAAALRILDGAQPDPQADGALSACVFIDRYLAQLDAALRSDVKALLSLLELYPTLTGHFTRFSRLPAAAQDAVLTSWERSRTALLRQGLQALKAMCFLAHYQDERSFPGLGYTGPLVPMQGLGRILPAR